MILIDNILVDDLVLSKPFLCDLNQCKGACCTAKGGSGAPLLNSEVEDIERSVGIVWEYLSLRSRKEIEQHGAFEGKEGDYGTRCINDRDCVFVYYEKGSDIAKCSIERAYFDGKADKERPFRKPLSCHLFPIRVSDFGGAYLYYEEFEECEPAFTNGANKDVRVFESVKDALRRAYGDEWYTKLAELAGRTASKPQNTLQKARKTT